MYWKWNRWKKDEAITAAKTDEFELPESGLVAAFMIRMKWKTASAMYQQKKPFIHDHITKIEVLGDGTDQIKELTGCECLSHYAMDHGQVAPCRLSSDNSHYTGEEFPIYFGTHLLKNGRFDPDREHLFDLAQYKDVMLEITNDTTSAYYDTAELEMDLNILTLQEAPGTPPTYLKTYEYKHWTPDKDGQYKMVDLPTKDKIRRIMTVQTRDRVSATTDFTTEFHNLIRQYKYTFNEGGIVVYEDDMSIQHWLHRMALQQKIETYAHVGIGGTNYYADSQLAKPVGFANSSALWGTSGGVPVTMTNREERLLDVVESPAGTPLIMLRCVGYGYLDSYVIDDYTPLGEANWYDPAARSPGQIEFYHKKDDGSIGLVLDVPKPNLGVA